MSHEFSRNIKDATLSADRALTAADGNVTCADFDLGADTYKTERMELSVYLPLLLAAELASADTLTIQVQAGAAASPTTEIARKVVTGTGSDIAAQDIRFRLPSDCGRYVNVKFTTAGTTGDMSDKTAVVSLRF